MRKLSLCFLFLLLALACQTEKDYRFQAEAESGQIEGMALMEDSTASGGQYLTIQKYSSVVWEVPVNAEGYYNVEIRYRARGGDKMQYLLKNGEEIGAGFDMAPAWKLFSQPFHLDSGINILGIRDGWGSMDLDWIAVGSTEPKPAITPKQNMVYLAYGRDLLYKIDNYHRNVTKVTLNGRNMAFTTEPYPYQELALWLRIPAGELAGIDPGDHEILVHLDREVIRTGIQVREEPGDADLVMVTPDVEHGSAMLLRLPTGRNMLIDCGKDWVRDSILIPMLQRHGVDSIHTFILTHYHGDHDGGDRGKTIIDKFHVQDLIDYRTFPTGHYWEQDGLQFKILNSYEDGEDENTRSLALEINYKDFRLVHGGDSYAVNQRMMLNRFPDHMPADVFYANHHFHGSVDPGHIIALNPDLVILQAQEAIYARAAYMVKYLEESVQTLNSQRKLPVETLPALEVGCIVVRVSEDGSWNYETYTDQDHAMIPGL